jgi:hypothetical protein
MSLGFMHAKNANVKKGGGWDAGPGFMDRQIYGCQVLRGRGG